MKPIRILFVDDDPEMTGIYQENFLKPEFESDCAANGMEALELLQKGEKEFDVIVSDNYMPQMDGITLLRKIRQSLPETNVIIVTGYGDWKQYVDAHNLGVTRFIDKPVKMTELKKLIRSLTEHSAGS